MKRSAALAGLSRDHHEALSVALRLRRAERATASEAITRFAEYFARRGSEHFDLEESILGPVILELDNGQALYRRLADEHARLRDLGATVEDGATIELLHELGAELEAHVRFEERELFPLIEASLSEDELAALGAALTA